MWPNNRLVLFPLGLALPSGKSWIRHREVTSIDWKYSHSLLLIEIDEKETKEKVVILYEISQ